MMMEMSLEEMVMEDIMKWKSQKDLSFINNELMIKAYWEEYLADRL